MTQPRRAVRGAVAAGAAFVVLTLLVATGVTERLDVAARGFFRPNQEWTQAQAALDILVEGLRPPVAAALLGIAGLCTSLQRRSWLPLAQAATIAGVGGALGLATKALVGRPDPSNEMTALGGSFPSGHVLSVLVCLGGVVLVLAARPSRWAWALVVLVAAGMGYGLLIQSGHWLTDVAGGALLGACVLSAASTRVGPPR